MYNSMCHDGLRVTKTTTPRSIIVVLAFPLANYCRVKHTSDRLFILFIAINSGRNEEGHGGDYDTIFHRHWFSSDHRRGYWRSAHMSATNSYVRKLAREDIFVSTIAFTRPWFSPSSSPRWCISNPPLDAISCWATYLWPSHLINWSGPRPSRSAERGRLVMVCVCFVCCVCVGRTPSTKSTYSYVGNRRRSIFLRCSIEIMMIMASRRWLPNHQSLEITGASKVWSALRPNEEDPKVSALKELV